MKRTLSILFAVVAILSMMVFASASVEAATLKTPAVTKTEGVANGVKLTWGKVSGAAKYRVFLHNGTTWKKLADTTATNYTYTKVKSGTTYKFTVRCITKDGKKFTSNYNKSGYSVKWVAVPKLKTANTVANGITVQWSASKGASKYRLFYKTAGSSWKKVGDTTATKLTYKGAAYNTDYTFTVRPVSNNGKVFEGYYNTKGLSFRRLTIPAVSVNQSGDNAVISWNKVKGAEKYRVFYKADGSGWKKIADTTSTAYTYSGMQKNKPYTFTVRTISADAKRYTSYYDTKGASLTILNTGLDDGLVEATEAATEAPTEKPTEVVVDAPKSVSVTEGSSGKKVYEKVAKYGIKTNLNTNTDTRMIEVNNPNTFFWQSFVTGEKYIDSYIEYLSNGNVRIHFTPNSPDKITKMEGWFYGESGTWYSFNIPTSTLKNGSGYYDYPMPELTAQRVNPSVKVSWGSSSNADGYDVTIKNASGKAASQTVHVGKNATSTTISLNTADSGSYTAEVKAIKGTQSKSATRSFSLKSDFVAESEASTIKVPVVFPNARFVCNRCGRNVSGKVKDHIIPIDSTELRERYADSLYTYKYKPTAGTNNAWVAAWAGTPDVTLTAGYYDLGDFFYHPLNASDPDLLVNCIWEDSLERSVSIPSNFSLAELQEKINNCGNQTAINLGSDFWLKSSMSSYHRDIEGCTSAYHEEDCVSISGLQTVVIPATGYTRVSLGTNQPYEPPTEPPTEEPTEEPKITAPTGVKYEVTSSGSVDYEKIITYNLAYTTEKNKVCRGTKFDAKEDGLTNTSFGMEHSIEYIGDGKARLSIDLDPAFIKENIKKNGYLELEIKFASKSSTVPILGVYADGTTSGTVTQDIILNKVSDTYPEIKVSWNKVPNADSYSVYVIGGTTTVNGQNLMKYFTDLKTTSCSFTITEQYASSFFVGNIGKPWYCNEFTIYVAATRGKQSVSTSKTFAYSEVNRPYNANDPYVYVDRVVEWK